MLAMKGPQARLLLKLHLTFCFVPLLKIICKLMKGMVCFYWQIYSIQANSFFILFYSFLSSYLKVYPLKLDNFIMEDSQSPLAFGRILYFYGFVLSLLTNVDLQ